MGVVQKRNHRVSATSTRARLGHAGLEVPVVNLSLGGACLAPGGTLTSDVPFAVALAHPHLRETTVLEAEVVWSDVGRAGVRFVDVGPDARKALRRCMLAEYGHGVWATAGAERPVGYVVPTTPGRWGLYDQAVASVGELRREGRHLILTARLPEDDAGDDPVEVEVPSVAEAAGRTFGLPRLPRIVPPLDPFSDPAPAPIPAPTPAAPAPAPRGPAPLHGSSVASCGTVVGYVARVGESWSFFDPQREPLGFMTQAASGDWRVVVVGADEEGAFDVRKAGSYPEALAAAFDLTGPPDLRSTVFQPVRLLDDA